MLVFVVFDLVFSCGVIVVSPCNRRWHNNLNEPLNYFPFSGVCWIRTEPRIKFENNMFSCDVCACKRDQFER